MKHHKRFFIWVLVCSLSVLSAAFAAESKPEEKLSPDANKLKAHLDELFTKSQSVNAKGTKQKSARGAIESALDWDQIAKDCLPEAEWKKQQGSAAGKKNISEFRNLLKEVIVLTAYGRLDTFWKNAQYRFPKLEVTGDKAHAQALFDVKDKEGSQEQFSLDYYLARHGTSWLIYDIAFEQVRYSENIREQIKTFLGEKGFPSLLSKLRERRKELQDTNTKS